MVSEVVENSNGDMAWKMTYNAIVRLIAWREV